jgi:hypothetical protein
MTEIRHLAEGLHHVMTEHEAIPDHTCLNRGSFGLFALPALLPAPHVGESENVNIIHATSGARGFRD